MVKKMKRFLFLMAVVLLAACSGMNEDSQGSSQSGREMGIAPTTQGEAGMAEDAVEESGLIGEKVIKTVFSSYETLAYEDTIQHIQELLQRHNGYVEYSYESTYSPSGNFTPEGSNRQYRRMEYTLRVPSQSLNTFLADLEGSEAVKISEQVGSQDITQDYRDTEARINVLRQKEERLNELLNQADTLDQVLQIEDSLSNTIAEREMLQSQLDSFDDLIDYTQVHLTITERMRVSSTRGDSLPFIERVREAFLDSLYAFYYWLQDAVIWVIYLLPFLVVAGLLLLVFLAIRRMYRKTGFAKRRAAERADSMRRIQERRNYSRREDPPTSTGHLPGEGSEGNSVDGQTEAEKSKSKAAAPSEKSDEEQ